MSQGEVLTQIVILLGGKLAAGKDEVADVLVEKHNFVKLGMSDVLAEALYRLNPLIQFYPKEIPNSEGAVNASVVRYQQFVDTSGYVEAKKNPEVRRLLQKLGTEVGRELLGENIWVDAVKKKIYAELNAGVAGVVLTGTRFPNELTIVESINELHYSDEVFATSVYVTRPGHEGDGSHASEVSLGSEDFEYEFINDSTLDELKTRAEKVPGLIEEDILGAGFFE